MPPHFASIIAALVASVGGLWAGAAGGNTRMVAIAAAGGAAALILGGVIANRNLWMRGREAEVDAARLNSGLLALTYAWGAAGMLAVYLFSGLKWQHGWQYGLGMALIAALIFAYRQALGVPNGRFRTPNALRTARIATALHVLAAGIGLLWLLFSGKLDTVKGDWAANDIFLAGGFAVTFLSDLTLATRKRLMRAA